MAESGPHAHLDTGPWHSRFFLSLVWEGTVIFLLPEQPEACVQNPEQNSRRFLPPSSPCSRAPGWSIKQLDFCWLLVPARTAVASWAPTQTNYQDFTARISVVLMRGYCNVVGAFRGALLAFSGFAGDASCLSKCGTALCNKELCGVTFRCPTGHTC